MTSNTTTAAALTSGNAAILEWHGYKLVERAAFEATRELPPGLLERAALTTGAWVVYDPEDDATGWLLIGDDPEKLAKETVEVLCL